MARRARTLDWGFPRWRDYGSGSAAATVRTCDRDGCNAPGDRPAPKAPNRPERWYFCEAHAAEYNRGWNYFEGLTAEEARAREAGEAAETFLLLGDGRIGPGQAVFGLIAPALIGNVIGGTGLFALLAHAQVRQEI